MTGGSAILSSALTLAAQKLMRGTTNTLSLAPSRANKEKFAYGTGRGTFDLLVYMDARTLRAGGSETFNLFDGSLLDVFGDAAKFRLLTGYSFDVVSGGDSTGVTIGNAGSNPHPLMFGSGSATKTVYPSGIPDVGQNPAGVAVNSGACNVQVTNNGAAAVTYALALWGRQNAPGVPVGLLLGLTYP